MRVLLIGANGMLGKDLVREWKDDELIPATSRDADIRSYEQVERLITSTRPEWVLLTAAYTDVDGSERDPDAAFAVNALGTENVAKSLANMAASFSISVPTTSSMERHQSVRARRSDRPH